ncbi:type I secretion system permease/ATPase [Magnetospira sp. QH-2]|uniref:type I secretion system permease/ATPase n=1 Tax=Magnetospira sp. (strain QH-2) TaxID=1288970 RepID=UPI0003E81A1C|nr:type I secretion system permease/ATPase [Magnetospira sp. QH-2]CCQ72858.1 Alkaline protease secretion ATP-binding protein (aprD,prtD) [Magnetospira sp. QH-2]
MSTHQTAFPFKQTLRQGRRVLAHVAGFSLATNLLVLVVPLYMIQVFDRVLTSRSGDTLVALTVGALIAFAALAALELVRSRLLVRLGGQLDRRLGTPLAKALADPRLPEGYREPRSLRDLETLRDFLTGPTIIALLDAPWVPLYILMIALLHPALGVLALCGALALLVLAWINDGLIHVPLVESQRPRREGQAIVQALSHEAETAHALGMVSRLADRWAHLNAQAQTLQSRAADHAGTVMAVSRFLRLALQVGIMGLAAWLVIAGELTAGAMIAASIILARALSPVEQAMGLWRQVRNARSAYARLTMVASGLDGRATPSDMPIPRTGLSFSNLAWFPRGADAPLFDGLNLDMNPGQVLGITGPSGGGKTSLARMVAGLVTPHQGALRLGSADLRSWEGDRFGEHLGYLPQNPTLFPGSIRDNIARFSDAPAEAVIAAAKLAGVHERIHKLPLGYDTSVERDPALLSGSLHQGIALARALFGDPHLVVLDEPYSNMDPEAVDSLIRALTQLKARRAVVVMVAQRPSLLAHCDLRLTLRDGETTLCHRQTRAHLKLVGEADESVVTPLPLQAVGGNAS